MAGGVLFQPGQTVTMQVSETSSRIHLPRSGGTVRVLNPSSRPVWLEWGDGAVVANMTHSVQMLPSSVLQFRQPRAAVCLAAITVAGSGADKGVPVPLNITFGEGS
jgi:hypothetical protein